MMRQRLLVSLALAALASLSAGQTYARYGVQLRSRIALNQMPTTPGRGSGCCGYVSPSGREYAIMGLSNGTLITEITNPAAPIVLNHIPGAQTNWHE
jgi:hypothetical protein